MELTKLIKDDMRPALGVTEPGAIAFAVAKAKQYTEGKVNKVKVALNSGMYKIIFLFDKQNKFNNKLLSIFFT